jgi:hypothetical protein
MSKKNKRKYYNPNANIQNNFAQEPSVSAVSSSGSAVSSSFASTSPVTASSPAKAVMGDSHAAEYRVIKHVLIKVVVLNALFLAGVLTLYYTNLNSHYLERWFGSIMK